MILVERVDVAVCALIDVSVDCTDNKVGDLCVSSKKRDNHKASRVQYLEPRLILGALSDSFTASSPSVFANLISFTDDKALRFYSSHHTSYSGAP